MIFHNDSAALEWEITKGLIDYPDAVAAMEHRVEEIIAGSAPEMVWLVEHPPLYTAGTSAKASDLFSNTNSQSIDCVTLSSLKRKIVAQDDDFDANLKANWHNDFPLYNTGRGGQITYHGPGQRVVYIMLNLKKRNAMDIRAFVQKLESWLIATLSEFNVRGETRDGRVGVWVKTPKIEAKIAALGIRVRKWVTFHGVSLNVNPDLSHYEAIVPCGIRGFGVTSIHALGVPVVMEEVDIVLEKQFRRFF